MLFYNIVVIVSIRDKKAYIKNAHINFYVFMFYSSW